ncbi:TerB family tellurite resistance protein [Shewanella algae]|uniref:tellurite resistance TerB family protein n=1 Tax=Shewanella algae TaxID=38313 RepID=UPI001AACACE9|nr:TerB family tellurite resistance protein [Shewanella algae]MBO2605406.1 TerB family tellurite resistance protein [Shewanella algae]
MIAKLKQFLNAHQQSKSPQEQQKQLELAAASMLLEVVYADEEMSGTEAQLLPELLEQTLGIAAEVAAELIVEAKQSRHDATSLFEFTSAINDSFTLEQKQQLILAMWRVAYADGELCRYEDQIIRRCADLLYLKHSELIQLRNQAMTGNSD